MHPRTVVEVIVVDVDPAVGDPNGPEEATGRNARAHVVDLMRIGRQRIYLILIDIESDEPERSLMVPSIHADVLPLHEPVVAVEQQGGLLASPGIRAGAGALHSGDPG